MEEDMSKKLWAAAIFGAAAALTAGAASAATAATSGPSMTEPTSDWSAQRHL
jgi:hypothetical protein